MKTGRILLAILTLSVAARWILCGLGGQYFFSDEGRYDRGVGLYQAIAQGNGGAVRAVASLPDHALFPWLVAGITAVQRMAALATPFGDWSHPENVGFTVAIGSSILSLFAVLNIWLVARIARAAGADESEALWSAALMAASNTGLYFSRHLLPYDAALSAFLGGLLLGLRTERFGSWLGAGLLGAACYELYNGFWFLPLTLVALLVLFAPKGRRAQALMGCLVGGALGGGAMLGVGFWADGAKFMGDVRAFSGTVTQGLFSEGWSLPWAYLYHSEGPLGLAVVAATTAAWLCARSAGRSPARLLGLGLAGLALVYALLVGAAMGHWLVVYARMVKALIPFFALSGGWAVASLSRGRPLAVAAAGLALAVSFGAFFTTHVQFMFPRQVEIATLKAFGNTKHTLSVSGSIYQELEMPVNRPDLVLVNAQLLYPVRGPIGYPNGTTVVRFEHPLSYLPFQYDGHSPREREVLRACDISIRLIRLSDPASVPDNLPSGLRFQASDRSTGY